jgi:hypothetical protein
MQIIAKKYVACGVASFLEHKDACSENYRLQDN